MFLARSPLKLSPFWKIGTNDIIKVNWKIQRSRRKTLIKVIRFVKFKYSKSLLVYVAVFIKTEKTLLRTSSI